MAYKPLEELSDEQLGKEWEGWLYGDAVEGLTKEQSERCIAVEREMDRRQKENPDRPWNRAEPAP